MSVQNRNALILLGAIVAIAVAVGIWRTAGGSRNCGAIADPYGAPPAQFEYRQPDVGQERQIIERANLQRYERFGLDVRLVYRGDELAGALYSLTSLEDADRDDFQDEIDDFGGTKRTIAGTETRTRSVDGGGTLVSGMKGGCYGMVVAGADPKTAGTLANAVFKN